MSIEVRHYLLRVGSSGGNKGRMQDRLDDMATS